LLKLPGYATIKTAGEIPPEVNFDLSQPASVNKAKRTFILNYQ